MSSVNELSGVHSFDSNEVFSSLLVSVWVFENNFGKRRSSTWVMHDVLDNTLDVPTEKKHSVFARILTHVFQRNQVF